MEEIRFVVGDNAGHVLNWKCLKILNNRDYINGDTVAAHFMVDAKGEPIPYEKALDILGSIPGDEVVGLFGKFLEVFNVASLNPTNGDSSRTQSPKAEQLQSGGSNSASQET